MRIEEIVKYIADDGREFDTEAECRQYEEYIMGVPRWIVNDQGEFGVSVKGRRYFYYKGDGLPVEDTTSRWRYVNKREFGEVIRSKEAQEQYGTGFDEGIRDEDMTEEVMAEWAKQYDWFTPVPAVAKAT